MDELKQWIAIDNNIVVHSNFSAPQSYIDDYVEQVVDRADRVTPYWYHDGVTFVDVTNMDPKPQIGWYRVGNGPWLDGNPTLIVDRDSIPADGTTSAKVTFTQRGPQAPANVTFEVNAQSVDVPVANGVATLDVTSVNPGDVIVVEVEERSVTINVAA